MWETLPELGTGVLYAILVLAAYTFAVALRAGGGQPRLLRAARLGAYATCALVAVDVLLLAYAFVTHDFRIRYVARYSDRSMSPGYLVAALWGGQDGSLLWWLTLLAAYVAACVRWLGTRYRQLQPWVIATLMTILAFFVVLMLFAANPFGTSVAGTRLDGEGLNPLLQNFYMIIHPPSLYVGFVGCAVPFAFAVAALVTGRLDSEWIVAVRKWMLFAWLFLSIGNALGMLWAYEELGWGGYWAWDPVENAACLPWFTASAWVHSTMIQERRGMLRVWNVVLICLTFFLTLFGTFLTRSGMIASVHSFAQSDIGTYFLWFMGFVLAASVGLLVWRWPLLRSRGEIESLASREAAFVANNWALVGIMAFVALATLYPKLSELWGESSTVGPPFFNRWLAPAGVFLFALMGVAPLLGWRHTSRDALRRAFVVPLGAAAVAGALHVAFGSSIGAPPWVTKDPLGPGPVDATLARFAGVAPLLLVALAAFNAAVVAQEFARGVAARRSAALKRGEPESVPVALFRLVEKARRRYGGYVVHVGVTLLFLGFAGGAWTIDHEASLSPGERHRIGRYELEYRGPRMETDLSKRALYADVEVRRDGEVLGVLSPAKFIYQRSPENPTTEVAMRRSLREDLYLVVGSIHPDTKRATFQLHVNPFVSVLWLGVALLIAGATLSLWPEPAERRQGIWAWVRAGTAGATGVMLSVLLAAAPARGRGAPVASSHGAVTSPADGGRR